MTSVRDEYDNSARCLPETGLIVVKVGSAVLARNGRFSQATVRRLGADIVFLRRAGWQVIVVSSGAVALGLKPLGLTEMPRSIVDKQAAAAVGQQLLVGAWAESMRKARIPVAQVLLTADDLDHRTRYLNARHTLQALLNQGVLPIVNENDSVAFDEIKMGDNDHLSALVTTLVSAQLLVMLTTVDGLQRGAEGDVIRTVEAGESVERHIETRRSATGIGGMKTKVEAARLANDAGIPAIIAPGSRSAVLRDLLAGKELGTYFKPARSRLDTRRRWIATATRPRGTLVVDDGARRAIVSRNASLLPAGILTVEGRFDAGSVVRIRDEGGEVFARGLVSYASDEIDRVRGRKGSEMPEILGYRYLDEIVHRNDLVVEKK